MQHDIQIWLVIIFLALLIAIQLFIVTFLIRVSNLVKPAPGKPGLHEIATRIVETTEAMNRAAKIASQLLDQIRPTVSQAAIVSSRQIAHADQVIGEVLADVERINQGVRDVAAAVRVPIREVQALSAGIRSATSTFFGTIGNSSQRKRC